MGDRLEYVNGRNYQRIDNGLGISFQLDYGFRVDYEHVFTSSTDNLGDMNWSVCATTSKRSQLPGRARLPWLQIAPTGSPAKAFTPQAGTIEHAITSPARLRPPASCREREFSRLFSPTDSDTSGRSILPAAVPAGQSAPRCWRCAAAAPAPHRAVQ